METLRQDVRYAARRLARQPGFTAVAVLTLAFGIGGNTAMFSVVNAVLLRPLPFADQGRVVLMWQSDGARNQPFVEMSYPDFRDWRDASTVFEDMAAMPSTNVGFVLTGRGEPAELRARWVTARFFDLLGVRPLLGRGFLPEDDAEGAPRVVVLSHALWRDRFGADAGLVGQAIALDGTASTVVGVMPPGFQYPTGAELWTPLVPAAESLVELREVCWMSALGRLKPGVSLDAARAEMSGIANRLNREYAKADGYAAVLTPISDSIFGPTRPALLALLGAVGLVLLIACANVAGLLLVQTAERGSEIALRLALGASRARVARQLFTESLLLALLGGAAGVLAAAAGLRFLVALSPADVPRLSETALDGRALGFTFGAALLTALLCGLAPMLAARKPALDATLREGSRRLALGKSRLRALLVVAEVATALVLVVGAGLLGRSFAALRRADLGFAPERILTLDIGLPEHRYGDIQKARALWRSLLERVEALPGVESAGLVLLRPLWGTVGMDWPFTVEGQSPDDAARNPLLNMEAVSPGYFETMGIPLRRGRTFSDRDGLGQPGVVIVSETLARRYWPGQDPVGKRLKIPLPETPYHDTWLEVVGVVGDARYREIRAARLDLYMSYLQANHRLNHLVVRAAGDPGTLAPVLREQLRALDRDLPAREVSAMPDVVSAALGGPRFTVQVFGAFAFVALVLAAVGLYGILACSVTRRTREIGVRMALGARPADVRRLVLGEGLALTAAGIGGGLAAAAAGARLLGSLLYGVGPTDGLTLTAGPLVLGLVAVAATLLPARRAVRVDPAAALRAD